MSPADLEQIGPLSWHELSVEPGEAQDGSCDCCGTTTRRVSGFVADERGTIAAYIVGWTLGTPDHGAAFDVIVGKWGEGAGPQDRFSSCLEYRLIDGSPAFMVVDKPESPVATSELAAGYLGRDRIIGTPIAPNIFALVDAVLVKDPRLRELREWK